MIYITEEESAALVTHSCAFDAARQAFIGACAPDSNIFPVVIGHGSEKTNRFTVKSGSDPLLAGLKVGSYFPSNDLLDIPRHSSITLLFDQAKGRIGAIVEGARLNAYRTAAADAIAANALSRPDARRLVVFGTGHQAFYNVEALARIRPLEHISILGRTRDKAEDLVAKLRDAGLPAQTDDPETACRTADIITTVTAAREPLFDAGWVKPGTHISSMGSDGVGKQELPPALFERAMLFCDLPEQSRRIGEFQHTSSDHQLVALGKVLDGKHAGRHDQDAVTIFDSSGISFQDLYMAIEILHASGR